MSKPELLAPAGDLEKLKTAVLYGADAVYIGGEKYGLRMKAKNFCLSQMEEGVRFAHGYNRRVYVTANILAHNEDLQDFENYINELERMRVDAVIVSDPGVFTIIRETAPGMEIHISTQANITNYKSALFWYNQGAKRVVLARELSLKEIKYIALNTPDDLELECFVHGAMCLSYSGRCYLSQYMSGRDANRGNCSQPCRWGYALMEESRAGEFFPVFEDTRGAYILNSKDLRMVAHIPELIEAGIDSFKIEGRMKTAYYTAG
jgi:putative protease